MKVWLAKQGIKAVGKVADRVLKAREIKRLRDYVEKDNELDIQIRQLQKTVSKQGKTIEELEKEVAILKKDSHTPVKGLEDRLIKLEKRR